MVNVNHSMSGLLLSLANGLATLLIDVAAFGGGCTPGVLRIDSEPPVRVTLTVVVGQCSLYGSEVLAFLCQITHPWAFRHK